ncbi:MAG TPA: MgtC/SapB family protein [Chitinophagaceae bacterium]|jgi:putative Mg2+ transporter-C (MgtC) family protein
MIVWKEILLRLSLAAFFGAVIGLERERKDWAAGLRTHMMVCLGASLTVMVSAYGFSDILGTKNVVLDPSRIAAQVISGIGFIGAGTILFLRKGIVRGLTTASGLWTVAAIGLATGAGMYFAALITTVLAIIILWVLQPVEKKVSGRFKQKSLKIILKDTGHPAGIIDSLIKTSELEIASCSLEKSDNEYILFFRFTRLDSAAFARLAADFQSEPGVKEITWDN